VGYHRKGHGILLDSWSKCRQREERERGGVSRKKGRGGRLRGDVSGVVQFVRLQGASTVWSRGAIRGMNLGRAKETRNELERACGTVRGGGGGGRGLEGARHRGAMGGVSGVGEVLVGNFASRTRVPQYGRGSGSGGKGEKEKGKLEKIPQSTPRKRAGEGKAQS